MGAGGDFSLVLLELPNAGHRVKKGDVVAEFDRQYMLNRLDDYKDSVIQAEANVKQKKANLAVSREAHDQQVRIAKSDMEKAKLDLQTLEVVSSIDAEKLKLAAEETEAHYKQILQEIPLLETSQKADLRGTELKRDESKIELQKSAANVEKMLLKAPMDGLVVMQSIRRGMEFGQAQKGDQVYPGQMFMQIVDPDSMVVNASVNQVDTELLRIGQKAIVRLDAYPGLELPAHVYSIGAVPVSGRRPNFMRQIPIRLKLDKSDPRIVPDLTASADVRAGPAGSDFSRRRRRKALRVPALYARLAKARGSVGIAEQCRRCGALRPEPGRRGGARFAHRGRRGQTAFMRFPSELPGTCRRI